MNCLKFQSSLQNREENWAKLTFAETSGAVTRDWEKNRPVAEEPFPSNNPRTNCGGHFCSSFPLEGGFELFIVPIFFFTFKPTQRASLMHELCKY